MLTKRVVSVVVAAASIAVSLAGCQRDGRPVVSLQQARQIMVEFQGQGFLPPPRTISDIAAILDQQKPDPAKVAVAVARADSQPPAGATDAALARFHFERGNAADELGRGEQAASDYKLAYQAARRGTDRGQRSLQQFDQARGTPPTFGGGNVLGQKSLLHWGRVELNLGKYRTAQTLATQLIAEAPNHGERIVAQMLHITASLFLLDFESAEAMLPAIRAGVAALKSLTGLPPAAVWSAETNLEKAAGGVASAGGRYAEAERHFRAALASNNRLLRDEASHTERAQNPPGIFSYLALILRKDLADSLLRQGRLVEAEVEYRASLLGHLSTRGRYSVETVFTVLGLSNAILEQGRFAETEKLARSAIETLDQMKFASTSKHYFVALNQVARAQSLRGDLEAAAATYDDIRVRMAGNPDVMKRFDNNQNRGIVALLTGQTDEARRVMTNVVQSRVRTLGEQHRATAMSRGILAAAKLRGGDTAGALADFDAVVPILMQSSQQADNEESGSVERDRHLRLVFESAMGAWAASNRPGAVEDSFRLADAIRGQGVQRALAQSSARSAASDPALAELVRREQDTQKQVGALQGALTNVLSAPERDDTAERTLRSKIDTLRGARAVIRQEIERRFPDYANLSDPRPATVEQARRSLRAGEALVATYVGRDQSFVWAVPQTGPTAFATVRAGQREIGEAVAGLRKSLDPNAASLGDVPAFDVALAHKLYTELLKPVEAGFANAASLLVVPHGALGQLPFGVLVTEPIRLAEEREGDALFSAYKAVPFLIRKAAITQLPSVASLGTLRALPAAPANRKAFVGFGDPWFSPEQMAEAKAEAATAQVAQLTTRGAANRLQTRGLPLVRRNAPATANIDNAELAMLPRLRDTADEVKGIAEALGAGPADVILGAAANERTVKAMDLSDRRVVMFATHGLIPGDLNGLLQPALALSAPNVADIDGDGLLTLDEVLALKLNADWVVLSACNTATGDGAGAEAVSGLGRAFFYAGTRALLVTNWPVETTSARALTTDLFARQARNVGLPRAAALQQAMAALIDGPGFVDPASRRTVFAYSHPIFWAPFVLVGDGGG